MKKSFVWPVLALLSMFACQQTSDDCVFEIDGQLKTSEPIEDSTLVFLVPMYGAHPRPVDSVYMDQSGHFRFEGNVEQMATLRLHWRKRYGVQDLVVCTEPGTIHVTLGEQSYSAGTPQNDSLQQWKEHLEALHAKVASFRTILSMTHDTAQFKSALSVAQEEIGEYQYHMMKGMGRNSVSMFINSHFAGKIDSLRREELRALFNDSTDYTKPMPGFRK